MAVVTVIEYEKHISVWLEGKFNSTFKKTKLHNQIETFFNKLFELQQAGHRIEFSTTKCVLVCQTGDETLKMHTYKIEPRYKFYVKKTPNPKFPEIANYFVGVFLDGERSGFYDGGFTRPIEKGDMSDDELQEWFEQHLYNIPSETEPDREG